mgnify:CR=1 FL=1
MNRLGDLPGLNNKRMAGKKKLEKKVDDLFSKMMKHPEIQLFRQQHPEISREQFRHSFFQLDQLIRERENCARCKRLRDCPNLVKGHTPALRENNGAIALAMRPCNKWLAEQEKQWRERMIRSHHIPKDILNATFRSIEQSPERDEVIEKSLDFCLQFEKKRPPSKGLYLYGPLGVGKSYIAGAIRQQLLHDSIDSYMVYLPEFMREMRASIGTGEIQKKIDAIKSATLLILDDIGAEYNTPWTRDEVLGAILQYRVSEHLPVIYTSNLNLDELEEHLAYTDKGGHEPMKAQRIMERIRHYVTPIYVKGINRRRKKK